MAIIEDEFVTRFLKRHHYYRNVSLEQVDLGYDNIIVKTLSSSELKLVKVDREEK